MNLHEPGTLCLILLAVVFCSCRPTSNILQESLPQQPSLQIHAEPKVGDPAEADPGGRRQLAVNEASKEDEDEEEESEELEATAGDAAARWFIDQRTYPFDSLPKEARRLAWESTRPKDLDGARKFDVLDVTQPYWNSLGPKPSIPFYWNWGLTSGMVKAIAIKPDDPQTVLIGANTGGIFRSSNGGVTFVPVSDDQVDLAVGSIAYSMSNPSVVYAGMGDTYTSQYVGYGIMKSTDAGQTWTHINNSSFSAYGGVSKIALNPTDPNRVYVALYDQLLNGPIFSGGVYVSSDGGVVWTRTMAGLAKDVAVSPVTPITIYAAMSRVDLLANALAGLYQSTDDGRTWQLIYTSPYNAGATTDIKVAVSAADPSALYVYSGSNSQSDYRLASSKDGGRTWTNLSLPSSFDTEQFGFNTYIVVDPKNANTLYIGTRDVWKSVNAGVSWSNLNHNYETRTASFTPGQANMHPDQHAAAFSLTDSNVMVFGNDERYASIHTVTGVVADRFGESARQRMGN